MKQVGFALIIIVILFSCTPDKKGKALEGIRTANILLTERKCSEALSTLNGIRNQGRNVNYIISYASALACPSSYSTTSLFANDLPNLNSTESNNFIASLISFEGVGMTTDADSNFTSLQQAIASLLLPQGISTSTHLNRAQVYGVSNAQEISALALYMILNQMGRFANYYGNADLSDGKKGTGSRANNCYLSYTNSIAIASVNSDADQSCSGTLTGSADLNSNLQRQCEGVILMNNFLDIITSLIFPQDAAETLSTFSSTILTICTSNPDPDFSSICSITTQSQCEDMFPLTSGNPHVAVQKYYSLTWDLLHK